MGKCANLSVPLLGKWKTLIESRDIFDVGEYFLQVPLQALFLLGSLCLTLQITWRKLWPLPKRELNVSEEEKQTSPRQITIEELRMYDGIQRDEIYVAVNRKVFDVTAAWYYYGPAGPDRPLAGKEASRALVTLCVPDDDATIDNFSDFNQLQLDYLFELETQYRERYIYVGDVVEKKNPYRLQRTCIENIRNAMQKHNSQILLKQEQVEQLPLPKHLKSQIINEYRSSTYY